MQPGERVASRRFIDVGIDLQCRADSAVSENDLGITGRDVQIFEQRSHRVAQVVDLDDPDLVVVADATGRTERGCAARQAVQFGW